MNYPLSSLAQKYVRPLRLVIAEDDPTQYIVMKHFLQIDFPHLIIVGHCETVQELQTHIAVEKPDILLLGSQLRGTNALEAVATVSEIPFDFIVISAQRNFDCVHEALRLGASDYIPKPYKKEKLITALHRVIAKRIGAAQTVDVFAESQRHIHEKASIPVPTSIAPEILCLRDGQEEVIVQIADICYIEADKHHAIIHTINGKSFRQYGSFKKFKERLEGKGFVQTHRSYIVALRHIKKLVPEFVVLRTEGKYEKKIPLSKGNNFNIKKEWREFHAE